MRDVEAEYDFSFPYIPDIADELPAIDIMDGDYAFTIKAYVPGINHRDLGVEVRPHELIIRGERNEYSENMEGPYLHREMFAGKFQRTITLPDIAHGEKSEAQFENGVLTVTVPKKRLQGKILNRLLKVG